MWNQESAAATDQHARGRRSDKKTLPGRKDLNKYFGMNAKRCAFSRSKPRSNRSNAVRIWIKLCLGCIAGLAFVVQLFLPSANVGAMSLSLFFCLILLGEKPPAQRLAEALSSLTRKS
jgi:hypothetical protein